MDVASAISGYVSKMVSVVADPSSKTTAKMKILLLDSETVRRLALDHFALYRVLTEPA